MHTDANMLAPAQQLQAIRDASTLVVEDLLGSGTQGEVYRVSRADGKPDMAVKWYYPHTATDAQRSALAAIVEANPPSSSFLWPYSLVTAEGVNGFGYVMPLRPAGFGSIPDLLSRRIEPTFRVLATAGYNMAHSFRMLHAAGLCYCDISMSNIFLDPNTGAVLIADNDNVTTDGAGKSSISGTLPFMAPELIRGETVPSAVTDMHSFGVLVSYMFLLQHPFEGAREADIHCLDDVAMRHLYAEQPLFIFDPHNSANRPLPGYHDNAIAFWPVYPRFFRESLTRTFTEGVRDPAHGRVREIEWAHVFQCLIDAIVHCPACHRESFYCTDKLDPQTGSVGVCWGCKDRISIPCRMRVEDRIVMLERDTVIHEHSLGDPSETAFERILGRVVPHPSLSGALGLRNESRFTWIVRRGAAQGTPVGPGKAVMLEQDLVIEFGPAIGRVRMGSQ